MRPKMAAIARQAWENRAGASTHPKTNMTMENPPSSWMIPNHYKNSGWKSPNLHPFKTGSSEFQVVGNPHLQAIFRQEFGRGPTTPGLFEP